MDGTRIVLKSLLNASFCTILSYFYNGVRYNWGTTGEVVPLLLMLLWHFVFFFLLFIAIFCILEVFKGSGRRQ